MNHQVVTRRNWLKQVGLWTGASVVAPSALAALRHQNKTILLHSSWQTVNIGDIAHTSGLIKILNDYVPDAKVILWPKRKLDLGVAKLLQNSFPKLTIVDGEIDKQGKPVGSKLKEAFAQANFMLHGSGPNVVGQAGLLSWQQHTGKPYGIYGVTIQYMNDDLKDLLNKAAFVYTRETQSLENLAQADIQSETGFVPDATFALHLLDEQKARKFMQQHELQARRFVCVIPRLRKTPYYKLRPNNAGWSNEKIAEVDALNEQHKEKDHAKAREAMITYVRETGNKVVVCPEMTYQLDIMDELLINPLPADVKKNVVKRDTYWLPDEASAVYRQALAVVSFECHSPIMAFTHGTPAFYLRQPEDTIKGQMWYDIGVENWVFEIEEIQGSAISEQLMKVHQNFEAAQAYRQQAMDFVQQRHRKTMDIAEHLLK